jgi:hypothetical protein
MAQVSEQAIVQEGLQCLIKPDDFGYIIGAIKQLENLRLELTPEADDIINKLGDLSDRLNSALSELQKGNAATAIRLFTEALPPLGQVCEKKDSFVDNTESLNLELPIDKVLRIRLGEIRDSLVGMADGALSIENSKRIEEFDRNITDNAIPLLSVISKRLQPKIESIEKQLETEVDNTNKEELQKQLYKLKLSKLAEKSAESMSSSLTTEKNYIFEYFRYNLQLRTRLNKLKNTDLLQQHEIQSAESLIARLDVQIESLEPRINKLPLDYSSII